MVSELHWSTRGKRYVRVCVHFRPFVACGLAKPSQHEHLDTKHGAIQWHRADPMNVPMLTPRFKKKNKNETRTIPYRMKWRSVTNTVYWFDQRIAQDKGLEYSQSKKAMRCYRKALCQPKVWVKVVKRNQDDPEGEILHQMKDQIREEMRHFLLKQKSICSATSCGQPSAR